MDRVQFQGYIHLLERMLAAGWIIGYKFTEGVGLQIQWNKAHVDSADLLKRIVKGFNLNASEPTALHFDQMCHTSLFSQAIPGGVEPEIAHFWCDCLDELKLTRDEPDFVCLVHGMEEFGPEHIEDSITRLVPPVAPSIGRRSPPPSDRHSPSLS